MAYQANRNGNRSLAQTAPATNPVAQIKALTTSPGMVARFKDVLGAKAPQFLASVVSAVSTNRELQKADPTSVMASAMVAATLNLDINPSLGFAAIIPYKNNKKDKVTGEWTSTVDAQFQIMTKGFVQLAIRSGQYRNLNVVEVYADELDSVDIITGELHMHPVADGMRAKGDANGIVGYVAYIELVSGFRKTVYWDMDKILNHAKKFSKSYDSKTGKFYKGSAWDTNFEAMCRKTVLKNALSSWGVLSVEMQKAVVSDQAAFRDLDKLEEPDYPDNPDSDLKQLAQGEIPMDDAQPPQAAPKATGSKKPQAEPQSAPEEYDEPGAEEYDGLVLSPEQEAELDAEWGRG